MGPGFVSLILKEQNPEFGIAGLKVGRKCKTQDYCDATMGPRRSLRHCLVLRIRQKLRLTAWLLLSIWQNWPKRNFTKLVLLRRGYCTRTEVERPG